MQETLTVGLVQANLIWEQPKENRNRLSELILEAGSADVFVLPEMFTTGFTMNAAPYAETMFDATVNWMHALAAETNAAICGSIIIKEENAFYNRFLFATPDGELSYYNKRHTFTLAGEEKVYTQGTAKQLITYKGWRINPMVCYDLRFPVWARNTEMYDVLLYVANWPVMRINAWDALLKARAIENMSYCIGVNRVGTDGNQIPYNGHSTAIDMLGATLAFAEATEEVLLTTLSKDALHAARDKFRFLNDSDAFTLTL